jgi:hypothetical protein
MFANVRSHDEQFAGEDHEEAPSPSLEHRKGAVGKQFPRATYVSFGWKADIPADVIAKTFCRQ